MGTGLVVTTLFEGSYSVGAAALINSLVAAGFQGEIVCGVRGPLPTWAGNVATGVVVRCENVDPDHHLTNYKPQFMRHVFDESGSASGVVYFDPDIVLRCPWAFIENWTRNGVAVVADQICHMPASSPIRAEWRRLLAQGGVDLPRSSLSLYFNAGFVGVDSGALNVIADWCAVLRVLAETYSLNTLSVGQRPSSIVVVDQEALNIALMMNEVCVSALGPEAMDFASGGTVMSHAIGSPKPWNQRFIYDAIRGYPPSKAAVAFFRYTDGPIEIYTPRGRRLRRGQMKAARILGTVFRRYDL